MSTVGFPVFITIGTYTDIVSSTSEMSLPHIRQRIPDYDKQ